MIVTADSLTRRAAALLLFACVALLPFGVTGCSKGCGGKPTSDRLQVSVSVFPIYDLVRTVAGPDADVALLLPPGHNEHSFDPTPKEIVTASHAKLGVMVGLGLDPWMEKLMKDAAPTARILKIGDRVPTLPIKDDPIGKEEIDDARHGDDHDAHDHDAPKAKADAGSDHDHDHDAHGHDAPKAKADAGSDHDHDHDAHGHDAPKAKADAGGDHDHDAHDHDAHGHDAPKAKADAGGDHDHDAHDHAAHGHDHAKGAIDPHVWLDPTRVRVIVRAIASELAEVDPAHGDAYRARSATLDASLAALDKEVAERTKALKRRGFVTFHGSFQYFAERYGLRILAVIEPFPGSQPTGEYVQKVLGVIKQRNVPALFSEPQLDPRPAKVLADEAKIPLGVLDPVGGSTAETDTYEKLIRFNVAELEKYLR